MSQEQATSARAETSREHAQSTTPTAQAQSGARELVTTEPGERGQTTIAETVVAKIASVTARDVSGVHDLGSGAARAWGSIRERIPGSRGTSTAQGVSVEVGERQAAVDVDVVVDYGVPIVEVSRGLRRGVIETIERMTGLEVVEVNISVDDVYIAGEETQQPTRVE